ncbi:ABC transporter arginine-binding protein 1 precursor [Hartmannibacter diazotrophicus]|uniref:ABC transporter arginine-binding protein 1 n=1 Tax=Hartmannibacter diazotrophicus TaxID=1482074 RepID=A0A2C9D1I5_9HYPH|nr:transporter substrate-binding domain-containing protein [Hartmannibacter diazotrophicus]SON54110.1 ABC transporter arginine-binding protein 1 precursor [Hartmannibacter diazotrophicus]
MHGRNEALLPPRLFDAGQTRKADVTVPNAIRFVTTDDFPPFDFSDGAGHLVGYNVELARAICQQAQIPCTIQTKPFDELVDAVRDGEADAIIAGLQDTEKTAEFLAFSAPYLRLPARFVVRKDFIGGVIPETLEGFPVAVVEGGRHDAFLAAHFPKSVKRGYASLEPALRALKEGEVDAVFADSLALAFWISGADAKDCCRFGGDAYSDPAYFSGALSIAVATDNQALKAFFDDSLARLEAKGLLADLYRRFLPVGLY